MSIDKLGPAAAILAALRVEVNNRTEATSRRSSKRSEAATAEARAPADAKALRAQLAEIARAVPLDDPAAVKAARPKVVRAILLWEFGASLREHPEWQPMLESITRTLEAHPPHQAQFLQLLADLKR